MDNGVEVFAKLPNPSAGPAHYTTASEVATRTFVSAIQQFHQAWKIILCCKLREVLAIPTPRILTWSSNSNNPVGAEYILEEKATGQLLGSLWYEWPMEARVGLIAQIVDIERKLADMSFNSSGCIYFNDHSKGRVSIQSTPPLPSLASNRFTMGPLVSERLWRGNRAMMDLDRGPFYEPIDFATAMAKNEQEYVKTYGPPRMNYHRSSTEPQSPDEAISLLERYLQAVQCTVPPLVDEDTPSARLWHPDLHLDNIFVQPDSRQITSIIDWQGATVMPLYYQCGVAQAFEHPGPLLAGWAVSERPENYNSLSQAEKLEIDRNRRSEICHKYYQGRTSTHNPAHWAAMNLQFLETRLKPNHYAVGIWDDQRLNFFRKALMEVVNHWRDLCPNAGPCPISFTDKELALQPFEDENMEGVLGLLNLFLDKWALQADGKVDPSEFDQTLVAINEQRGHFIDLAKDADERVLFARLWPFQDGDRHDRIDIKPDQG